LLDSIDFCVNGFERRGRVEVEVEEEMGGLRSSGGG